MDSSNVIATLIAGACLAGCATPAAPRKFNPADLEGDARWVAVSDVPLVREASRDDGGAAALSMLLSYWHVPATPDELKRAGPSSPEGAWDETSRLCEFARSKGLRAYVFRGEIDDLRRELARSRPVLVGVGEARPGGSTPRFEVVVALHPERQVVVTLDAARGWQESEFTTFLEEWDAAQRAAMVAFKMDDPTSATP
jgi:ABC-type bacteriocin/lantibiotic exporter with double-glycine peptidase domain